MAFDRFIPIEDHAKIRTSDEVRAELARIATELAARADGEAEDPGGYGTDMNIGTDRARAHVWPKSKKAKRAEAKNAYLMTIAASEGAVNKGDG